MPYKYCVRKYKSNYFSEEKKKNGKVSVYRFPLDEEERKKWIRAIPPENLVADNNTRVCRYHWPPNCKSFISYRGKERLTESPSVFDGIPAGCLSLPPPKPRNAVLASGSSRNVIPDELEQFREVDSLVYGDVIEKVIINYDLILFFRTRSRNKYTIIGN